MQWNCEALSAKIDELKHLLKQHKIDRQPNFPGYAVNRVDRSQKRGNEKNRGRGVMIGVRDTLAYRFTDQKLRIKNIYVPSVKERVNTFKPDKFPNSRHDIVLTYLLVSDPQRCRKFLESRNTKLELSDDNMTVFRNHKAEAQKG